MLKSQWMAVFTVILTAGPAAAQAPAEPSVKHGTVRVQVESADAQSVQISPSVTVTRVESQPATASQDVVVSTTIAVEQGEYWLGIQCFPVMPALRSQLGLPEKQGLLVVHVAPEGPAAKAGIVQHDVLLRIGEKPLAEPRDLVEAIEASKGAKLKIELVRGGKPQTLEATPAKRPERAAAKSAKSALVLEDADWITVQRWMEGMAPRVGVAAQPPMRFRIFHPGAIVPRDVLIEKPLPAGMSIVVSKEGDQPAKINVKRGNERWELTEKELEKLPPDVRPHVDRMLGRSVLSIAGTVQSLDFVPSVTATATASSASEGRFATPTQAAPFAPRDLGLEKRLDEMNRRMDQLLKAFEEFKKQQDQK